MADILSYSPPTLTEAHRRIADDLYGQLLADPTRGRLRLKMQFRSLIDSAIRIPYAGHQRCTRWSGLWL